MVMFQRIEASETGCPGYGVQSLLAFGAGTVLRARIFPEDARQSLPKETPLLALHGVSRDSGALWNAFSPLVAARGRALLVPDFCERNWPRFQQIGKARPDLGLLDLMRQAGFDGRRADVFGFSGGAQLAHRFAMLYPHRVATLHLAAPGWYTMPDAAVVWPFGLAQGTARHARKFDPAALSRLQLRQYLSLKVRLWVGALDTERDASLRQSDALDTLQGKTRVERACRYAETFERAACAMGVVPDIELTMLPGCGHNFTDCAVNGGLAARVVQGD